MADVTLTYKGQTILELSATGNKAIKTAGKYCEGDINLAYEKDESNYNILKGSAQPATGIGQDGDVYLQYADLDGEIVNTYVKISGAWVALVGSDVNDVANSGMFTGAVTPPPASLGSDGDYYYYYQSINWQRSIQSINPGTTISGTTTTAYGTEFTVNQAVTATHLCAMIKMSRTGKLQIGTTSEILAEIENVSFNAEEWTEVLLPSPIRLTPGTNYVVKVTVTSSSPGYVGYVDNISKLNYDSKFSYVATHYGPSWPGTVESRVYPLVCVGYAESGLFKIIQQFHKESGSWAEIT